LKFDTEGAEIEILQGARTIFDTNRTHLIISIYHRASDLESILNFVAQEKRPLKIELAISNPTFIDWGFLIS
jgi:hypothetical protein